MFPFSNKKREEKCKKTDFSTIYSVISLNASGVHMFERRKEQVYTKLF